MYLADCIIKDAYYGVKINNANYTIENSEFDGCQYGIYAYQTNGYSSAKILNNNIHHSLTYGIYLYQASPEIRGNSITNGGYGLYCSTTSSPKLGKLDEGGNNLINANSMLGVYAYNGSNPFLGREACNINGGYNSIYGNTSYEIGASLNCVIEAEKNWWGNYPPNMGEVYTSSSTIDIIPALQSNPWSSGSFQIIATEEDAFDKSFSFIPTSNNPENVNLNVNPEWPLIWKTRYVRNLVLLGNYKDAARIAKKTILENPDSSLSIFLLDLLWQSSSDQKDSLKIFCKLLNNRFEKTNLYAYAGMIEAAVDKEKSIAILNSLENAYDRNLLLEPILFQKFLYFLNEKEDINSAMQVQGQLSSLFPNSIVTEEAQNLMSDYRMENPEAPKVAAASIIENPAEYKILGNFPNPFNPNTMIAYYIPNSSKVELKVYNILGSEVKSLISAEQAEGRYDILWDGTNNSGEHVSSGIYIYRLSAV